MPTVYDVQTTTRKELERKQKGKAGLKVLYSDLELATENLTQHHNITTRNRGRRSAEICSVACRWHVVDVVVGCVWNYNEESPLEGEQNLTLQ
jgi:hypothetical protein